MFYYIDPCSLFLRLHHPVQETREPLGWCKSKVPECQQLQPVSGCQRAPAAKPSSHPVERPSRLPPGMMLHLNPYKSPPPSGMPETLDFKLGCYNQRSLGLGNCSGFCLDLVTTPHQLSVPLTVPQTKKDKH